MNTWDVWVFINGYSRDWVRAANNVTLNDALGMRKRWINRDNNNYQIRIKNYEG